MPSCKDAVDSWTCFPLTGCINTKLPWISEIDKVPFTTSDRLIFNRSFAGLGNTEMADAFISLIVAVVVFPIVNFFITKL